MSQTRGYRESPFDGSVGTGESTNAAVGFFSVSGQAQQNHIADATDAASAISGLNTLLADLEGFGLLKTS